MLIELTLIDYSLLRRFRPSVLAAAAVSLSIAVVCRKVPSRKWVTQQLGVEAIPVVQVKRMNSESCSAVGTQFLLA
jgi:hypothetical protein